MIDPCAPARHTAATLRRWDIFRKAHPNWTQPATPPLPCVRTPGAALPAGPGGPPGNFAGPGAPGGGAASPAGAYATKATGGGVAGATGGGAAAGVPIAATLAKAGSLATALAIVAGIVATPFIVSPGRGPDRTPRRHSAGPAADSTTPPPLQPADQTMGGSTDTGFDRGMGGGTTTPDIPKEDTGGGSGGGTPIPEPPTVLLLLCGVGTATILLRRRA